jgi:uncharacterized membrane protein
MFEFFGGTATRTTGSAPRAADSAAGAPPAMRRASTRASGLSSNYLLLAQWPSYLAFLTSFATTLIMWINHHRMFTLVGRSDDRLMFYNGLLLLGVTVVPFPTSLVA